MVKNFLFAWFHLIWGVEGITKTFLTFRFSHISVSQGSYIFTVLLAKKEKTRALYFQRWNRYHIRLYLSFFGLLISRSSNLVSDETIQKRTKKVPESIYRTQRLGCIIGVINQARDEILQKVRAIEKALGCLIANLGLVMTKFSLAVIYFQRLLHRFIVLLTSFL